jgi:succinate dehydrogenase / fumarate reductase membrane anchor subunit
MAVTIERPHTRADQNRHPGRRINVEKWGWIFMRVSGVLLVVLIFGHLFINLVMGDGVKQVDFAFIAGKWASPFWQVWDGLMLWLALIHGGNGMRTITNDYVTNPTANRLLKGAILVAVVLLILLGTLVITTFDPCPVNAAPGTLDTALCHELGR